MIQLKDKLKVNGGTRRYMEMIGLSLAFSLFAVSCTQDSDTFYPSSPEEEHPSVDESRMIPIQLSVERGWIKSFRRGKAENLHRKSFFTPQEIVGA